MKTQELNQKVQEINGMVKELEQAKLIAKELFKEQFAEYGLKFNEIVDADDFKKAQKIQNFLNSILNSEFPEILPRQKTILKVYRKENLPSGEIKIGPITDKKYFDEVLEFGKSFLSKEAFQGITSGIEWNSEEKRVQGSKPEFIILCGDYDVEKFGKSKTPTAHQLWENREVFKDKNWVDQGYYLNGNIINSETAVHFIQQFEEIGWAKNGVLEKPVKIDLRNLTFNKNREGLIFLTDKSIYTQTEAFLNGDYHFNEVDEYGINIKSNSGKTNFVPTGNGFYRCCFDVVLVSGAWDEYLRGSNPGGLVVRELA